MTMTAAEIAEKLNVTEKVAALWRRGFRSTKACDDSIYYVVSGHAFDGVALTEENAREIGVKMGRRSAKGDARCH